MNEFHFNTKLDQTILLGRTAKNVRELLEGITAVPDSAIYFHTHRYLHQHHFLSPEPPNDFAYWISEVLNESKLGEIISSIDIIEFHTLHDLRQRFIKILTDHLKKKKRLTMAPEGHEFHFMSSHTFVLQTPYIARTLAEFKETLRLVSVNSLYYHIFDAKLRLEKGENDFSRWFRDLGKEQFGDELTRLDPYTYTLEGLRNKIIQLVRKYDSN